MGLFGPSRARVLSRAQDMWDRGQLDEAVAALEAVLPSVRPGSDATDARIVATLATYVAEMGDPPRGLALLAQLPLDRPRLSDVGLICLGARAACRAMAGHIEGARRDRATIYAHDPGHAALIMADMAIDAYASAEAKRASVAS